MEYSLQINRKENLRQIIFEERAKFIQSIFDGFSIEFKVLPNLSLDDKERFCRLLNNLNIQIIDVGSAIEIYKDNQLIGTWGEPVQFIKDGSNLDIRFSFWTIFDNG